MQTSEEIQNIEISQLQLVCTAMDWCVYHTEREEWDQADAWHDKAKLYLRIKL